MTATERRHAEIRARKARSRLNAAASADRRAQADAELTRAIAAGERAPTPQRITLALDLGQLYGPQVDADLGVLEDPPTVVDDWEAGRRVPTLDEVKRLAELTGFPWGFFYLPPPPELGTVFVCRR